MLRKGSFVSIVLLVAFLLWRPISLLHRYYLSPCPESGPKRQQAFDIPDMRMSSDEYSSLIKEYEKAFEVTVVSEITYEGEKYPIYEINATTPAETDQRRLLIFAGVHGDEVSGMLALPQLLDRLLRDEEYKRWDIRIVAPVNPVGLVYASRYNGSGCDINRDFDKFDTQEARLQRDEIERFDPDLIVSLHEGPQDGFFLIGTESVRRDLEDAIVGYLQENDVALAKNSFLGLPLGEPGVMHEGRLVSFLKRLFGIWTLGRYAESTGVGVITTESSWNDSDAENRARPHLLVLYAIVRNCKL